MPHDARGNLLKAGDRVLVPFIVKDVFTGENDCNVSLESEIGMPPSGYKTALSAINTKQMIRGNFGDDTSFSIEVDPAGAVTFK